MPQRSLGDNHYLEKQMHADQDDRNQSRGIHHARSPSRHCASSLGRIKP